MAEYLEKKGPAPPGPFTFVRQLEQFPFKINRPDTVVSRLSDTDSVRARKRKRVPGSRFLRQRRIDHVRPILITCRAFDAKFSLKFDL